MNARWKSALTAGSIAATFIALFWFAMWVRGIQNENYYRCRLNHDKDYCMWHTK